MKCLLLHPIVHYTFGSKYLHLSLLQFSFDNNTLLMQNDQFFFYYYYCCCCCCYYDPLNVNAIPQHVTPSFITKQLGYFNHMRTVLEHDVPILLLGKQIWLFIMEILERCNDNLGGNVTLISNLIELLLHQFSILIYEHGNKLFPLFISDNFASWRKLMEVILFSGDVTIRSKGRLYLYEIYVKFQENKPIKQNTIATLVTLWNDLPNNESNQRVCEEFCQFLGDVIKYYCLHIVLMENGYSSQSLYSQVMNYFKWIFENAVDVLCKYESKEYSRNEPRDQYVTGLLIILKSILMSLPEIKKKCPKIIEQLRDEILMKCLFHTPDQYMNTLENLMAPHLPQFQNAKLHSLARYIFEKKKRRYIHIYIYIY
ncbi:hypothetical protein RFI_23365, partial [Reticulomyxa filosa]